MKKKWNQCKQLQKHVVPRATIPVVLMRNLAVGNTYTIIISVQGGRLEVSEISENGSEEKVESVQTVKKDGVPRGAIPAVLMRSWLWGTLIR